MGSLKSLWANALLEGMIAGKQESGKKGSEAEKEGEQIQGGILPKSVQLCRNSQPDA